MVKIANNPVGVGLEKTDESERNFKFVNGLLQICGHPQHP